MFVPELVVVPVASAATLVVVCRYGIDAMSRMIYVMGLIFAAVFAIVAPGKRSRCERALDVFLGQRDDPPLPPPEVG